MREINKLILLLAAMAAMLFLPWLGGYLHYGGHFPAHFFNYPDIVPISKPGFNLPIFVGVTLICAIFTSIYLFPGWYGFKKVTHTPPQAKASLPIWFWVGFALWGVALGYLSLHLHAPAWFIHWSDVPLFWGFTLMLDGWVYKRTGKSLVANAPKELIGIGFASMSGWMIFEFLNFFVDDNWYYPWGNMLDREEFLLYAFIVSSGLMPLAFEFYLLFKSCPQLATRFSMGKIITLSTSFKNILLWLALASMFASGLFPDTLFFTLWVSPPVILAIVLNKMGVWTPFDSIGEGNWSPTLLSALTYFVTGFLLEGQNYLSAIHQGQKALFTMDPAYWQYSLPYVNVGHIFEMPFLGFYGYLPFGIYCWLWWIAFATLLNIPAKFLHANPLDF